MRRDARRNIELIELAAQLTSEREARAREAVGAERARIARELHDAVAHTVSVMTIQTGGVRRRLDTDPERVRERDVLLNVEHLGREAVEELHRAVGLLRSGSQVDGDAPLTPPRLADIDQLVAGVRAAGIPVEVKVEGTARPLPSGLDLVAYRVVQEALTNTLKHAGPARAQVIVSYGDTDITISVLDTGQGREDSINTPRIGLWPGGDARAGSALWWNGRSGPRLQRRLHRTGYAAGSSRGRWVTIRVLLVDDEAMIRTGLRMVLEAESDIEVVGEAGDGAQAVTAAATTRRRPDGRQDAPPRRTGCDTTDPRRQPSSESRCSDNIQ